MHHFKPKSSIPGACIRCVVVGEIANNNQKLNRQSLRWNKARVRSFFLGIKPGGGDFLRKPGDQTDTLLLSPGSRNWAIVKHGLQQRPLFSTGFSPQGALHR